MPYNVRSCIYKTKGWIQLGKQLLIRGTKGSRKITLTEEGMILRKRAEEILNLVQKTEKDLLIDYLEILIHSSKKNIRRSFVKATI